MDEEEKSENPPERENQASTQSDEFGDDSEAEEETEKNESLTEEKEENDSPVVLETENETGRYPKRSRNAKKYPDYVLYHTTYEPNDPKSFEEAMNREDSARWKEAMEAELQVMAINEAWTLVDYPKNKKTVKNKWVFRTKRNSAGDIKYKARLVAKGFTQEFGSDYNETFSPVVRHSSIRLLIALSAELDLDIDHLDVNTAFLNGELSEEIYMHQPEGFIDSNSKDKVCLLKKAIYGLKQSSRVWNKKVEEVLIKLGFQKSKYEACIFFKISNKFIVALYVDDFLIFSNDKNEKAKLKEQLKKNFKIKDLGQAKRCLGLNIERDRKSKIIRINQKDYILELLASICQKRSVLQLLCKQVSNLLVMTNRVLIMLPYQQLIGALMYLAVNSRPDIAFATSFLSQFNIDHTEQNWKSAKRILRYLKGSLDHALVYKGTGDINITGYADAGWANDAIDRKSYTGYVFMLANGPISWEVRKQRSVALSSTEAEYIALSESAKEAIHLKGLLNELIKINKPITLYNDNQSAQKLVCNPIFHNRTKHVDIKYHFVREALERNEISVKYMSTDRMIADIFTKPLNTKHIFCLKGLGLSVLNVTQ